MLVAKAGLECVAGKANTGNELRKTGSTGLAPGLAQTSDSTATDVRLAEVIAAWAALPETSRVALLGIVQEADN